MPLYEYRCLKCGKHVEKIQKFSDPPLKRCEHCRGRLERLLSASAIQFKGSGWYVTDYPRKPSTAEGAKTEGAEKPSDGSAGEAKKAEKPAPASASPETKTSKETKSSK